MAVYPAQVLSYIDSSQPSNGIADHGLLPASGARSPSDHGWLSYTENFTFSPNVPMYGVQSQHKPMVEVSADAKKQLESNDWNTLSVEDALASLHTAGLPSLDDYISILRNCRKRRHLAHAKHMRSHICHNGLETLSVLESYAISMFVDCGSISYAEQIFTKVPFQNEKSWASLMQGYIEIDQPQLALDLYQMMQKDVGVSYKLTFIAVLKACVRLKCIDIGEEIHGDVAKEGFEEDIFVGSTLVDMYVKCGALLEARDVFDDLAHRDVVLWTTLIAGFSEQGFGDEALKCLEQMKLECVLPDAFTYVCTLKACGSVGGIGRGQELHALLSQQGYRNDIFVSCALVDMYSKCGLLSKAQDVFDELPVRDVVSWTALLTGYTEEGLGNEALGCFERMQLEGVAPDPIMYACSLTACGSIRAVDKGLNIHSQVIEKGYERDAIAGNMLVEMYAKCGLLSEAWTSFKNLVMRDAVSWNALIAAYAEHECVEESFACLEQMQMEGFAPNSISYLHCLKACSSTSAKGIVQELHSDIVKHGFERDTYLGNTLVLAMSKCGSIMEAKDVFDGLIVRNVVSWNALMGGYVDHGFGEEAIACLEEMQLAGISPDPITYIYCLKACGSVGAISAGQLIHSEIVKEGFEQEFANTGISVDVGSRTEVVLATTLIDMYAKCGNMVDAKQVFNLMPNRDNVIWNALITAYALHGESEVVFFLLEEMAKEGCSATVVTFLSVLTACSHAGLPEEGRKYFWAMREEYGISPTIKHRTCMIDLLGRAGQLEEAVAMLDQMHFQPDLVAWSTVLGACHKHGNLTLGRCVFEGVTGLGGIHSATFVLMSNIFADAFDEEFNS